MSKTVIGVVALALVAACVLSFGTQAWADGQDRTQSQDQTQAQSGIQQQDRDCSSDCLAPDCDCQCVGDCDCTCDCDCICGECPCGDQTRARNGR